MRALLRAIQERTRANDWFEEFGGGTSGQLEGHRHFRDVLQQTLGLFENNSDQVSGQIQDTTPGGYDKRGL